MKLTYGYLSWCMPLDIHITGEREERRRNLCVSDAAHNSQQPLVDIRKIYILSIILFKKLMTRWGSLRGSQASLYVASHTICKMRQENKKHEISIVCTKSSYSYFIHLDTSMFCDWISKKHFLITSSLISLVFHIKLRWKENLIFVYFDFSKILFCLKFPNIFHR